MNFQYVRVAIDAPLYQSFDYLPAASTQIRDYSAGMRVLVPFGKREVVGMVVEFVAKAEVAPEKIKRIKTIIDAKPLINDEHLTWLKWISSYYHHPLGETLFTALPVLLRTQYRAERQRETVWQAQDNANAQRLLARAPKQWSLYETLRAHPQGVDLAQINAQFVGATSLLRQLSSKNLAIEVEKLAGEPRSVFAAKPELNAQQQIAIDEIKSRLGQFCVTLLQGVTGSGKTEVYLSLVEQLLGNTDRQILILVPEIGLTPQLVKRFENRFNVPLSVMHSGMNDQQRLQAWLAAANGEARIVIGTRSAVFTPMPNLGLIILDEEHDSSYKQQEGLRYHARDMAIVRAQRNNIAVVLGSATPSLESLANIERKRFHLAKLPLRAGNAVAPRMHVVDLRNQALEENVSPTILGAIRKRLDANEQVLLFLNRRGYAPTLLCHGCGWIAHCDRCSSRMTIHQKQNRLRCHHCGAERKIPEQCADCGDIDLRALGFGTERIERYLAERFPDAEVFRIDRDSTRRKDSLQEILSRVSHGQKQILLGTQMLAKGHDFPNVTLVALLNTDSGLFGVDLRASEHLAQLIVQVAGRAGRGEKPGEVYIQTHHPDHPLLQQLLAQGYARFAQSLMAERRQAHLPPYSFSALIHAQAKQPEPAKNLLNDIATQLRRHIKEGLEIMGPVVAPMERKAGFFRFHLMLLSENRALLHNAIDHALPTLVRENKTRWNIDVDPIDLH